jgi:23S rRNA (adenine1618-N6)-methyltransferase
MSIQSKQPIPEVKEKLHPRNKHKFRYNFPELIASLPELGSFVSRNQFEDLSIDFKNPDAVKTLNKALLKHFYAINWWEIPVGYLSPPIPGRADYIHYAADLLASGNNEVIPRGKAVKVLDIGVGANCIYPLIGNREYGWNFVGSEIDAAAIRSAKKIVHSNMLSKAIEIRKQKSAESIFADLILPAETYDLTICNPPFHASLAEANAGTIRKWKNLGAPKKGDSMLNFGGNYKELWYGGGKKALCAK